MMTPAQRLHAEIVAQARLLENMAPSITVAWHNARTLAVSPELAASDRPRGEDAGIRSKGHITDPTGDAATSIVMRAQRQAHDIGNDVTAVREAVARLKRAVDELVPVDPSTIEARRCGEMTPREIKLEDWYTKGRSVGRFGRQHSGATCTNPAMNDTNDAGKVSWPAHGLCISCYQYRRRSLAAEAAA